MKLTDFASRVFGLRSRQGGTSLIWPLATVAISTMLIVSVNLPKQIEQQQENQSMADTNTATQIVSAVLSYYDDNRNISSGVDRWPSASDLNSDLAKYLPVLPSNSNFIKLINLSNTRAELLINAETNVQAQQLVAEFKHLDARVVNEQGNSVGQNNTWVKLVVDTQAFGTRTGPDWDSLTCSYENGKKTRELDCEKESVASEWCLGSDKQTQNCELDSIVDPSIPATYSECNARDDNWGTQTKIEGCKHGWYLDGTPKPCGSEFTTQVSCKVSYWAEGPESCNTGVRCNESYYWQNGGWIKSDFYFHFPIIWNIYERRKVFHCVKGRLNEEMVDCGLGPSYVETQECPELLILEATPYVNTNLCKDMITHYNGVPYRGRGW